MTHTFALSDQFDEAPSSLSATLKLIGVNLVAILDSTTAAEELYARCTLQPNIKSKNLCKLICSHCSVSSRKVDS